MKCTELTEVGILSVRGFYIYKEEYDLNVMDLDGNEVSLAKYKGKVVLIINSATKCGFTPQYKELQEIYDEFKDQGFAILDFPCDQFGNQAPGTDEEIHTFCTGRFGITFPQFAKVDVKGEQAIHLFQWLTIKAPFEGFDKNPTGMMLSGMLKKMDKNFKDNPEIKWNFTKFLVDKEGKVVGRYSPTYKPEDMEEKIKELL